MAETVVPVLLPATGDKVTVVETANCCELVDSIHRMIWIGWKL
ncbi:MAG: hypothetical protein ABIA75_06865 [Candidatus Neomarinimicrobiota bacterium]